VVHVVFPGLAIDSITLGLFAVAAVPWLVPVVKSFKFGGVEVDLRDLEQGLLEVKDRVEESAQRVEEIADQVQKIAFSGAVDAGTKTVLEAAMGNFYTYLSQAGFPVPNSEPKVEIADSGGTDAPMYYDARKDTIRIAKKLAVDVPRVLQAYCEFLCVSVAAQPYEEWTAQLRVLRAGLSTYLPCSYRGRPELGEQSFDVYRAERAGDVDALRALDSRAKMSNLETNLFRISVKRFSATRPPQARDEHASLRDAMAWGGTFWRLRAVLGPDVTDRVLIEGWTKVAAEPLVPAFEGFLGVLVRLAEAEQGATAAAQVREVFSRRGLVSTGGRLGA